MIKESGVSKYPEIHGAMIEFDSPEELIVACKQAYAQGYRKMDAYAPMPVEGLAEAIGYKKNKVALCALIGGICGVIGGLSLLEWISNIAYAHNVGGRPTNSWPAFIPITFECMILCAALTAVISMLAMNGLPRPHHAVFNVTAFERASIDKFFLCIESTDPKFAPQDTILFLENLGGKGVTLFRLSSHSYMVGAVAAALLLSSACRNDMHNQPRYKPLSATDFFGDGRSARPAIDDTVARGQLRIDSARFTGKVNGKDIEFMPIQITKADVERGQQRFNIYCSPCHGQLGNGHGMIVTRGLRQPPSYLDPRLVEAPIGHFFDVMTNGYGSMYSYASRVAVDDRWRIASYIRALQMSQNAPAVVAGSLGGTMPGTTGGGVVGGKK